MDGGAELEASKRQRSACVTASAQLQGIWRAAAGHLAGVSSLHAGRRGERGSGGAGGECRRCDGRPAESQRDRRGNGASLAGRDLHCHSVGCSDQLPKPSPEPHPDQVEIERMQAEGITPTDDSMYSVEAVQQRIDLLSDPVVVRALEDLWQAEAQTIYP